MSINFNVNPAQQQPQVPLTHPNTPVNPIVPTAEQTAPTNANDIFETTTTRPASQVDMNTIRDAISQAERQTEAFRQLVERLLGQQGQTWTNAAGEVMVYVDEATQTRAAEEIAEGGYFSVEAVSERLLNFARAFAGDDPERIELMRDAFLRGFEAAEQQWGGELPQISQDTRAAVLAGFDEWIANINQAAQPPEVV